jgi:hypothetical protein
MWASDPKIALLWVTTTQKVVKYLTILRVNRPDINETCCGH